MEKYCPHANLRPERWDTNITVCLDCKRAISLTEHQFANGRTPEEHYEDIVKKLDALKAQGKKYQNWKLDMEARE